MKLIVDNDFRSRSTVIFLEVMKGNSMYFIGMHDNCLVEQLMGPMVAPTEPLYPLLEMDSRFADEFIQSVVEYASGKGIVTENENLLKGKLQATEKHLDDLRMHFDKVLNKIVSP